MSVLDNLESGRRENIPAEASFYEMDIRDEKVGELWAREAFDVLIHHAAQMDVRRSVSDPQFDADVNIRGFLNLMEAGRRNGLEKIVFASTGGAIYGEPDFVPQTEDHSLEPLSPYGITKLTTEKYLYFYRETHDIDFIALRYANIYGPRQNPHGEAGVVAIFTRMMLEGKQPIINGKGTQTRDYTFVEDVVRANMAALTYDASGTFNVGTGQETSVNELFHMLRERTGASVSEQHGPAKPGEQQRSVLGYEAARKALGWRPEVSIEEGLSRTVAWFEETIDAQSSV